MKNIFTLFFILVSLTSISQIRISQVYGAGGNSSATYTADFVELFNAGASSASLASHSIQYASAAGTTWTKFDLPAVTLLSGQYFLIQMNTAGAIGVALPAPDAIASPILSMSGTAGKVALVNSTTALTGTQCPPPFVATIIDYVGYGSTANCFEGTGPTPIPVSNANSLTRLAAGCTDNNNNAADFTAIIASARNTASPLNPCGAPVATLVAGPDITNITTNIGIESTAQTFTLSGFFLTGFAGNISVTASANFEVSLASGSGYASSINVPFTSATLSATTIYVHIIASAPQGALTGTVTCSGGGALSNALVNLTGGVFQNYYNTKANLGLTNTGTWSTTTNGAGASPANFINPYQLFNIISQANANYSGIWDVSNVGNSSRIIVGDGSAAISLTILPGAALVTSASRIDVLNNATLVIQNNVWPFLNNLATGSTVDFAQTGTTASDTIRFPAISYYNLKLTGGLKYFSGNTTTVRGNLTTNGVLSMNGSSPVFSTVNVFGNVSFLTGSKFESLPSGDGARITLAMNGNVAQTISGGTDSIYLFRLQRDSISSNGIINLTAPNLALGNNSGGGLRLNQGAGTTTTMNITNIATNLSIIGGAVVTPASNGKINSIGGNINIAKTTGTTNAGTLRFTTGTSIITLSMNCGPSFTRDSIVVADSVKVSFLNMNKGKVVVNTSVVLSVADGVLLSGGHITGGSSSSFVDGKLRRFGVWDPEKNFPIGKGNIYAPLDIEAIDGDVTVEYFPAGYGTYIIDPATLLTYPNYKVSLREYWVITKNAAINPNPTISFYYTTGASGIINPAQIKMAHFDGTDWDDIAGTAGLTNTTTNGNVTVTNVTTFSPFTFSARVVGVIPVKLHSFTVQKLNNAAKLTWITSQEINSKEFIVERSVNGTNWTAIANIPAAGNSDKKLNYTTTDFTAVKGINFYRIKQVDLDAKFDYSATKSILFSSAYEVLITPNPATSFINIYLDKNNNNTVNILLMDGSGKMIRSIYSDQPALQINTIGLGRGLYYVKVIDEKQVTVSKILLQ